MSDNNLEKIRHSLSHLMASAVWQMFPQAKFAIGPVIENGFYYDFDLPRNLTLDDLPKIEKKMRELLKQDIKFERLKISVEKAKEVFKNQPYKIELLEEITAQGKVGSSDPTKTTSEDVAVPGDTVTVYRSAKFIDLCAGPHVDSTKEINPDAFRLTKIAGAYWRGDEKNKMLQRIYGVAFNTKKELDAYLKKQEEIELRDHRILNKDLHFYSITDEIGAGLVIWHPHGSLIRGLIEDFWKKEHAKRGYQYCYTPHIGHYSLWVKSGHTSFYQENMYPPMVLENTKYQIKPMNCLYHVQIFKSDMRSYKDLPIKYCELGTVYRYEKAGTLHGLLRVRSITQDDAHIFCRPDQVEEEVIKVLELAFLMLKNFGFKKFEICLSTRDQKNKEKYLGSDEIWQKAEKALENALKKKKLKFKVDPGEAVFYGPKIDIKIFDSLGRGWQGPTIQVDFNFPEKFDLNYIDDKGNKQKVVMIHRTVLGAMERFMGNLMEEYAGAFPIWLSPIQVSIINVGKAHRKYCEQLGKKLKDEGIRIDLDLVNETVPYRVRKAEKQKVPYILVIGDKEKKGKSLNVRLRGQKQMKKMTIRSFIEKVKKEIRDKK